MSETAATATPGYLAARSGAAFIDRSDRLRIEFTGTQAAATLNGLLTNDTLALAPGAGQYAAALTAKGKVIADVRVFARADSLLVDAAAAAGPSLLAMLKKYVNPRLAKYRDVSQETCTIGVVGPTASRAVAAATGVPEATLSALSAFGHVRTGNDPSSPAVARVPGLGVPGFDVFANHGAAAGLEAALARAGALALDPADAERLRIEAGQPMYGADMDENVLAQEAGLDRLGAISFEKGCYTGQETVARVHFRGHVNRTLRGLRAVEPIATGAELVDGDGAIVGVVRSSTVSPRFGPIALAYVRREIEDGVAVTARIGGVTTDATVVALPF